MKVKELIAKYPNYQFEDFRIVKDGSTTRYCNKKTHTRRLF